MDAYRELYEQGVSVLSQGGGRTLYRIDADGGYGQIVEYDLYPGISLQFNDIHCIHLHTDETSLPLLELNYCAAGRYECEFRSGSYVHMDRGCFAANRICRRKTTSSFPAGHYRGISVILDPNAAQSHMDQHCPELALRLSDLPERLCPSNTCFIAQAEGALQQVFCQIEDAPPCMGIAYYRVKVLELLTLLSAWSPNLKQCKSYLTQSRVELMRHIRDHLRQEIGREITLSELAREHGVCMTALKRDFTAMYGISPSVYRRRYRMDQAANMLAETGAPIMQIAVNVGYLNASKFSAAFRAEMGITPAAFRKKAGRFGAETTHADGLE